VAGTAAAAAGDVARRLGVKFNPAEVIAAGGLTEVDTDSMYEALASRARLEYGPAFRCLRRLWSGRMEAVGHAVLPEGAEAARAGAFAFMHSGLLDSCLHAIAGLDPTGAGSLGGAQFLPVSAESVRAYQVGPFVDVWCRVKATDATEWVAAESKARTVDVAVYDGARLSLVATVDHLVLLKSSSGSSEAATAVQMPAVSTEMSVEKLLYGLRLHETAPDAARPEVMGTARATSDRGGILLLSDRAGISQSIDRLVRTGDSGGTRQVSLAIPVAAATDVGVGDAQDQPRFGVRVSQMNDFTALLRWHRSRCGSGKGVVVQLWPLDHFGLPELAATSEAVAGTLHMVQALAGELSSPSPAEYVPLEWPRLCIVTRGAQECGGQKAAPSPAQSAVVGLARVIEAELPELDCVCVDLDPDSGATVGVLGAEGEVEAAVTKALIEEAAFVLNEVDRYSPREQIVCQRGGAKRFVARLERLEVAHSSLSSLAAPQSATRAATVGSAPLVLPPPGTRYRLSTGGKTLDETTIVPVVGPVTDLVLPARSIAVAVRASGMNFRDVLIVLKPELFPDHKGDIGFECSGVVAEVGPGCGGRLRVGDEVIAMCGGGCYGSHAVAQEDCVVAKPAGLTYEKAAALPVAGVTAAWCLERIAQVGPG
jgi:hypothetical protein